MLDVFVNGVSTFRDESSAVLERLDGGGILVHEIDLFEGKTFGLRNAEEGEDDAAEAGGSPDEEDVRLKTSRSRLLVDEVRGYDEESAFVLNTSGVCRLTGITNAKIPQPVGGD